MAGIEEWRVIAYLSCAVLATVIPLGLYARYLAQNLAFLERCQHEITQGRIDHVLRCVEEPEPPPEKVITGLIPPR